MSKPSFIILKWKVNGDQEFVKTFSIHKKNNSKILESEFPEILISDENESNSYSIKFYNIGQFENHTDLLWANLIRMHSDHLCAVHPEILDKEVTLTCVWSNDREKEIYVHHSETAKMTSLVNIALVDIVLRRTIRTLTQLSSPYIDIC